MTTETKSIRIKAETWRRLTLLSGVFSAKSDTAVTHDELINRGLDKLAPEVPQSLSASHTEHAQVAA